MKPLRPIGILIFGTLLGDVEAVLAQEHRSALSQGAFHNEAQPSADMDRMLEYFIME